MTDSLRDTLQRALGDAYRVERELGGGGMSRVFVARDLALDRDVVVKVLSQESTAGVSGDRFRREIQVIARLQHPHIVSILSAGAADGALFYVMPFIGGETLRARISREGPLAVADAVRILREVLDALAFAHKRGVIHRDIKPENVLVEAGHSVVADFGIAKALRESGTMTSAGVALGTPAYMAPEQATADPTTDHRADLYAVGVLAYELLAGVPPFTGSPQQVITAHLTTPAPPLRERRSDVPEALADLVARALAKEPGERPQSAGEMLAALDAAVTPVTPPRRHTEAPVARAARPRRWRLGVAATIVLAVVAAAAAMVRSRTSGPIVAEGADLIAVMPLGAVSDTSLARLGQDLVVTLSTNLDGVGSLRTIDAVTLLMRARKLTSPLPLADAQGLAKELGARSVLTGTLITEGERVRASVVLYRVGSDSALAKATALAAPKEIAALTDSLTWEVLRQVWRRGTSPSPVLTGLTTSSFDALRAFLDGERHFQRLEVAPALADYRRAFERDSNFVQAFLRHDAVNSWNLQPPDSAVRGRLLALLDRLPERERLWVQTREQRVAVPARIEAWQALVRRFPDYPPALMSAADVIIHWGPLYGIAITDALPLLERLDQLVPDHADTKFHQAVLASVAGTPAEAMSTMETAAQSANPPWNSLLGWMGEMLRARATGQPMPLPERAFEMARTLARVGAGDPTFATLTGLMGFSGTNNAYRLGVLDRIRQAGIYTGEVELASAYGEGALRVGRGDWVGGLRALRRLEPTTLPMSMRITSARLAAVGAWLDAVDARTADSVLRRVRTLVGAETNPIDRAELRWLDGLVGVTLGDEARVRTATSELLSDTLTASRYAARSLTGLWMFHTNAEGAADTLKALSDAAMRDGGFLLSVESVDRLVVARALRRRGAQADAERYLMWVDAAVNTPRNISIETSVGPLVAYERGVAFDDAGDGDAAVFHLRRFVEGYDLPPQTHRALVEDAKQRLLKLEKGDAPPRPKLVP